jgi:GH15 family glucan-1,4-alpha-glucosidase
MPETDYQPIENYGIIGDLNTVALVGLNGSIDFLCFPNFDSPSVFASLLDKNKGGYFKICPKGEDFNYKQFYLPDTNVLLSHFLAPGGVGEIADFMPVEELYPGNVLIRHVTSERGTMTYRMACCPRFNYARSVHKTEHPNQKEIIFRSEGADAIVLRLVSSIPLEIKEGDGYAVFTLQEGETADFVLELLTETNTPLDGISDFVEEKFNETINYWKGWIAKINYSGRWREMVHRSALALKLMTSYKYGSTVAAPTFSLPEEIGGKRNWDYRFTWIRDASFTIYALVRLGYKKEAREFMEWVEQECEDIGNTGALHLMYTIDGELKLEETELSHLEGYKKSSPVRIGNAAYQQVQLDIYGELLDSVYLYDKYVERISYHFWKDLTQQVDWVTQNWQMEDEGIWEVRGGKKQFLYSRLMCWVAVDRGIKIGQAHSYPLNEEWVKERDKIFHSIHNDFWNEELQAFVQYKGSDKVDASILLMPIVRFISPKDPLWLSTLSQIEKELVSASLVYRYRPDEAVEGLTGGEGTFSMCTFWYAECLALSGQVQKARLVFEKMLSYANHVGLYAEQIGLQGEHLGNFPQAFTHLGLISAALSLDDRLNDERNNQ